MTVTPFPYHPERVAATPTVIELLPSFIDLAERISNTEFVPTALRRRPEAVLAALMSGAERGLGPMESLRSVHVIEGRPSLSAEAMRALVLAAGHDIEIVESTAQRATVVGRRAGSTTTSPPFTWTLDRARRARLANKQVWQSYPEAMLLARASTDLCRAVFPDVIAGLASTEEVTDELAAAEPVHTTTRRAPRRTLPATITPELVAAPASPGPPNTGAATPAASLPVEKPEPGRDDPAAPSPTTVTAPQPVAVIDDIPGSDRPSWGHPPPANDERPHDPNMARRVHATITATFPDETGATRDRWRHALVAVITRKRPDGPATSSNDLSYEEQLALSDVLARIAAGQASVADGPDDTIEVRAGGGWRYTVTLDPINVAVRRGDDQPEQENP